MNASTIPLPATDPSLTRRFVGVAARPQSYRNIAYLLLGLPLGTLWFSVLVTVASVSVSMLVVALLGIPMIIGMWYAVRAFANVERAVANTLLDEQIDQAPMAAGVSGNLWVRFKTMGSGRDRWRELGYLLLRFPAGVATFTLAVTALTAPVSVAYAPIYARYVNESDDAFGNWFWSTELRDFANGNPWSWTLIPAGIALLFAAFHTLNAAAGACARWTIAWLGGVR